jgi:nicotinamide phosphoribosyltransferase
MEDEFKTFKRLITDVYPTGIVSIVSDTWDFWKVITDYLPRLKDTIMARDGRVVIRPDSGDPVKIICGDPDAPVGSPEYAGAYELLGNIFGTTLTPNGYKMLDTHIGLIYGDSITLERQKEIYRRLEEKEFAATNLVLGVGSYTYQYKSRDSLGFAMKATWCHVNGEEREIFKCPKTDSGMKKSLKGLIRVYKENGKLCAQDCVSREDEKDSLLETIFKDGVLCKEYTLAEVRQNVNDSI